MKKKKVTPKGKKVIAYLNDDYLYYDGYYYERTDADCVTIKLDFDNTTKDTISKYKELGYVNPQEMVRSIVRENLYEKPAKNKKKK